MDDDQSVPLLEMRDKGLAHRGIPDLHGRIQTKGVEIAHDHCVRLEGLRLETSDLLFDIDAEAPALLQRQLDGRCGLLPLVVVGPAQDEHPQLGVFRRSGLRGVASQQNHSAGVAQVAAACDTKEMLEKPAKNHE